MTSKYIELDGEQFIHESKELDELYAEACEWITYLGVPYTRTRFGQYERDFKEFVNSKNIAGVEAKDSIKTFFNARMEATELIRVKDVFDGFGDDQIIEAIKKSTSGQLFRNGRKEDQSRDFAFELSMAARFLKAGYEVDLRTITDIEVQIGDRKLYVECKRIKSVKQLGKRISEANNQIRTRINKEISNKNRGMIALNLTDLLNPDSRPIITKSINDYSHNSKQHHKNFILQNENKFKKKKDAKCLCIFSEYTTEGFIHADKPEDYAFVNVRSGNFYEYDMKGGEKTFLDSFREKLGNQDIS